MFRKSLFVILLALMCATLVITPCAGEVIVDVQEMFYPTGWMGDWQDLTVDDNWNTGCHSGSNCVKVEYSAEGSRETDWAGIYWQYPKYNWGEKSGMDLSGTRTRKLTFWAKGKNGGENVEFMVGGITGNTYEDSISPAITLGVQKLNSSWVEYTIDLSDEDLSSVIGGFCLIVDQDDNPSGCTIYLDDIVYES